MKKQQLIMLDEVNYLEARKRGIIQKRMLSEIVNNFLSNIFNDSDDLSKVEILNKKSELESKQKILQKELFENASEISILQNKLIQIEKEKKLKAKEEYENIKKMNQSIKNSGLLDDILPM